jgi:Phosphotransferase enzyme family
MRNGFASRQSPVPAHKATVTVTDTDQYSDTVKQALGVLFGGSSSDALVFSRQVPDPFASSGIVLADNSSDMSRSLAAGGYRFCHRFALLPSRERTRWLVPRNEDCQIVNGLEMYPSFSIRATVYKSFASRMAAMGWPGWTGNSLWVASKQRFPIEKLVEDITGESRPQFSLSLGTAVSSRKLTVQVMRRNGEILGYLKLPLTEKANARIQAEAATLERLNADPRLRARVPAVLHASKWGAGHLLFQSPIMGDPGPSRLTVFHQHALNAMHSVHTDVKPGTWLVRETSDKINSAGNKLGPKWNALAEEALRAAAQELSETTVRCGLGHGDFTPWNTRLRDGILCLVDWEMASWEAPILWDTFHFLAQTKSLLQQGNGPEGLADFTNQKRALYMLYLVSSAAHLAEEAPQAFDITFREAQLCEQLRALSGNVANSASFAARGGGVGV